MEATQPVTDNEKSFFNFSFFKRRESAPPAPLFGVGRGDFEAGGKGAGKDGEEGTPTTKEAKEDSRSTTVLTDHHTDNDGFHAVVAVLSQEDGVRSVTVTEQHTLLKGKAGEWEGEADGAAGSVVVTHQGQAEAKKGDGVSITESTKVEVLPSQPQHAHPHQHPHPPQKNSLFHNVMRRMSLTKSDTIGEEVGSMEHGVSPSSPSSPSVLSPSLSSPSSPGSPMSPMTLSGAKTEKDASNAAVLWLSKVRNSVKSTFISKETEEAFAEIGILFDKLFDDFPYNKVDLLFGLMMVDDYYKNTPVLSGSPVTDIEMVETIRYYMKFACCCYGWKFIYGILNKKTNKFVRSMVGDAANVKALHDLTGVEASDIILAKWTSTLYDSGHYICLCREKQTIVVAFRGTFHIRDCLTDLVASNTPFMHGSAHTGLLRNAKGKYQMLAPVVLKALADNPTYKVVVVGHSLGAATASLFTLLLHEAHPEVPVHCYAYAPPCVVSPDIALSSVTQSLIDAVVVGNDIVPRLSFATLNHLKHIIMDILAHGNNTFQRAFHWMSGGMQDGSKRRFSGFLKLPPLPVVTQKPVPLSDIAVFPPGRIFHLVHIPDAVVEPLPIPPVQPPSSSTPPPSSPISSSPPKGSENGTSSPAPSTPSKSSPPSATSPSPSSPFSIFKSKPKKKKIFIMEHSNPALFNEIIIAPNMFVCHMPSYYDKVLDRCLTRMKALQQTSPAPADFLASLTLTEPLPVLTEPSPVLDAPHLGPAKEADIHPPTNGAEVRNSPPVPFPTSPALPTSAPQGGEALKLPPAIIQENTTTAQE